MTQGRERRRIRIYEVTRVNHDVALRPVAKIHSFVGKIVTCNSPEVNSKVLNRAKATSSFRARRSLHLCLQQLLVFDSHIATSATSTLVRSVFPETLNQYLTHASVLIYRNACQNKYIDAPAPASFRVRMCVRKNASSR